MTLDWLTEAEADSYWTGRWLARWPVPSARLPRPRRLPLRDPAETDVAELSARIRIEIAAAVLAQIDEEGGEAQKDRP